LIGIGAVARRRRTGEVVRVDGDGGEALLLNRPG
jgi:hypothetical protein